MNTVKKKILTHILVEMALSVLDERLKSKNGSESRKKMSMMLKP